MDKMQNYTTLCYVKVMHMYSGEKKVGVPQFQGVKVHKNASENKYPYYHCSVWLS